MSIKVKVMQANRDCRLKVMTSDVGDGRCYHQLYLPVVQDIVPVYFSF